MSATTPEAPAWPGFEPVPDDWQPAPAMAQQICAALGRTGRLLYRPQGAGLRGFYQLMSHDDEPDLFLKVVSPQRAEQLLDADRIASWLADQGLPVAHLRGSFIALKCGDLLLSQDLLHGRVARTDEADMDQLGTLLARLHTQLAALPDKATIETASRQRDQALTAAHTDSSLLDELDYRADEVLACLKANGPELPTDNAQPLHGDLNLGNVLFTEPDDQPTLLDFEDSLHNWHSPKMDLAMALERFVLVRVGDNRQALALGRALFDGYRQAGGRLDWTAGELGETLQALAVRALLLLARRHAEFLPVAESEWDKFLALIAQTHDRVMLLEQLEQA